MNRAAWRRGTPVSVLLLLALLKSSDVAVAHKGLEGLQADPAQWVMPNGNYAGWNYSALDQINLTNVQNLSVAWTFQLGILDTHEASPLVVGDTMYIVTPKPNYVYALDLRRDGAIKDVPDREQLPQLADQLSRAGTAASTSRSSAASWAPTPGSRLTLRPMPTSASGDPAPRSTCLRCRETPCRPATESSCPVGIRDRRCSRACIGH